MNEQRISQCNNIGGHRLVREFDYNDEWETILSNFDRFNKDCKAHLKGPFCSILKKFTHNPGPYREPTLKSIEEHPDNKYLTPMAIFHYREKTLDDIIDPDLWKQMDPQSFNVFAQTAYDCLNEEQSERPDIGEVVTRLEEALKLQMERQNFEHSVVAAEVEVMSSNHDKGSLTSISSHVDSHVSKETKSFLKDLSHLKLSYQDIASATNNFDEENIINIDEMLFKGRLAHSRNSSSISFGKLTIDSEEGEGYHVQRRGQAEVCCYLLQLEGLGDTCAEVGHNVPIKDSLEHVFSIRLRLRCVGRISSATSDNEKVVIQTCFKKALYCQCHRQYECLRNHNGTNLKLSLEDVKLATDSFTVLDTKSAQGEVEFMTELKILMEYKHENVIGLLGYCDEEDEKIIVYQYASKWKYWRVLEGMIVSVWVDADVKFAWICNSVEVLHGTGVSSQENDRREKKRPTAAEVIIQLKKALEFQEDYEIWEPKLPKDYKEIIQMSKCPENYSIIKKEDLYNIFSEGILIQQDKVLLSFVGNGERNEMVSATMFSYINSCPHGCKSLPESRFGTVVEMLDISNLNIEIKTRAQLLSPNVVYGVYLVFKFCDSRNFSSKPAYVNLKYRKGHKSLNAYFATWRDNEWMMIELYRFLHQNEDVVFGFLLECFSSSHCGDGAIYVEGIEFRAIEKVKHDETGKLMEVPCVMKSNFILDQLQQLPTMFKRIFKYTNYDKFFWLGKVNGKKLFMISSKIALHKSSNVNIFRSIPSAHSRFRKVIELLPQQVFHINCTIKSQMLSPDTEYVSYLVFKLSQNCQGLHYPVKIRDILHQENNEAEFVYFITPSPLNVHDITQFPKQREDGWMEIQLCNFNSTREFKDGSLSINMKFTSLEGIMSGLIVCGLEFRPA
ncbi:kinase-like domain, phloem protein 2-like protein [Tanacetum coccineum]